MWGVGYASSSGKSSVHAIPPINLRHTLKRHVVNCRVQTTWPPWNSVCVHVDYFVDSHNNII